MKNIVIVGAGYSGVLTAKHLEKKLRKNKDVTITLIDRNPFSTMLTELHEVAAGRVHEDSIRMDLKKIFTKRKVQLVLDEILSLDSKKKVLTGCQGSYQYDYLVMASGSKPTFYGIEGAETFTKHLWSYQDAVQLHEHILDCFRRAMSETDEKKRQAILTFYVVGAGFTGVEMIGELAEYVPVLCKQYGINKREVNLVCVDMLPRAVAILPEKLSEKAEKRLHKMGVTLKFNTAVKEVGKNFIRTESSFEKIAQNTETVIWTAGIQSSALSSQVSLLLGEGRAGRIETDPYLRTLNDKSIFVVGDNIFFTPKEAENPVPQLVENAEASSKLVAFNLIRLIKNETELKEYNPKFHGVMVCIGGRYGIARVGTAKHQVNLPSFLAMFAKHFINIIYFIKVLGWNKVSSYLRHEFFTVRNKRSFVGGHFSNRTLSLFLVPLRLWLGFVWLFEGLMKVAEGWMTRPKLLNFFSGANAFYQKLIYGTVDTTAGGTMSGAAEAANQTVDAVAAGTAVMAANEGSSGVVLFSYKILESFDIHLVSTKALATASLADHAFKIDIPLLNRFLNAVVLSSDGMQLFMQISIVSLEILIGLALMSGFLTTPAVILSIILQLMFMTTTGIYLGNLWMIFGAVALIGAGKVFGLDYYSNPFIKKSWKKLPIVRKWYLYHD